MYMRAWFNGNWCRTRKEMQEGDGAGGRRDAAADGPVDPWAKFRKRGEKPRVLQNGNNKKKK